MKHKMSLESEIYMVDKNLQWFGGRSEGIEGQGQGISFLLLLVIISYEKCGTDP